MAAPISPKPPSIIAQLAGSGTAPGAAAVVTVMVRSSIAMPSSEPLLSVSNQRMPNTWPAPIDSPPIVPLISARLAAALPFSAPAVPLLMMLLKSSGLKSIQVPLALLVASSEYWKLSVSSAVVPRRHCSPK